MSHLLVDRALTKITWGKGTNIFTMDTSTEAIDFNGKGLEPHDAQIVASMLPKCLVLNSADLSDNHIGADGAKAVAGILPECKALNSVDLSGNDFKADGAKAVAGVLPECTLVLRDFLSLA